MASGLGLLGFRCTGCGNCCRDLRVPLTRADLQRLVAGGRVSAADCVEWLATGEVDLTGEPGSLVQLDVGPSVMMLAQRGGAGRFLGDDQRCTVYAERPASCALYPFDPSFGARGGLRRLRLLGGTDCDHARDGHNDAHALRAADVRRWQEHTAYLEQVRAWNRRQRHRALLGRRAQSAQEFLSFLGFDRDSSRRIPAP